MTVQIPDCLTAELPLRNCKQVMNWLNYPPVSVKMENGAASEIRPRR